MQQSIAARSSAAQQLDLERRLGEIPSTACVRGIFFNLVYDHLKRLGKEHIARRIIGSKRWPHVLYPVAELLEVSALAAPHVHEDANEALRQIWSGAATYVASTWFGRVLQRVIRPNPAVALEWIENAREHQCNYGRWRVEHVTDHHVVLHIFDEYIWIDSAHRGGCEGLLVACGVHGTVTSSLDGMFSGRLDVRWMPVTIQRGSRSRAVG